MNGRLVATAGAALGVALWLSACSTPKPRIQAEGETYDGMVPVTGTGMKQAWVKPDINISTYKKILLAPAEFDFRATRPGAGTNPVTSTTTEFPITQENRQRLVETVTTIFSEELAKSRHFTLTNGVGPEVLLVQISLLDIVSRVPPEQPGRSEFFLDEFGSATLVLELRDSTSGEILARAVDRRTAEPVGGLGGGAGMMMNRADDVTTWSEVRRVARRWAAVVTQRIDQLYTRGRMPGETIPPPPSSAP